MENRTSGSFLFRIILMALCLIGTSVFLFPTSSRAQSPESVKQAMALLKSKTAELGGPVVKGEDSVAGKQVPALYFGGTKMNNNFAVVDEVKQAMGGTASLFVKSGDDFVRVATNVQKADGSRAIGTVLDPKGKAIAAIRSGSAYYGDADILGKPYVTGYDPIRDSSGTVIGIYYVGYPKAQ
ncbi:methyl-accepting chemotaxis protein [Caballeronia hypogeia]|uniref:Methyl-accepting chemotaxis protein n=1 Tax=Caballeronia hypogeia TaxID=1777140 RepID=A0A158CPB8_9BURK|nr:Cache 3/Cache 2 fusion domain-containing protein [Caballeronia hypogeia]SAK84168.1 methyl-accepting chemotaxis protein [Caballeronia hypogeia]